MTLLELSEPLFQYMCRLNRSVRKGLRVDLASVRNEIMATLSEMKTKAAGDRALVTQYERVELVLLFFVDSMIKDSCGAAARGWQGLAADRKELAGDERFFELLDEALKESGEAAAERLSVYYTCMGLGFTGWYSGQPEYLRNKMKDVSARIRSMLDADQAARICPEAYENVNTANLVEPPGRKLIGVGIALTVGIIVVCAANVALYRSSKSRLEAALTSIIEAAGGGAGGEGER